MIHAIIKARTSSRSSTEEEVIHSAWGEVREGFSDIKPQLGFEGQEELTNWTKRGMASELEETA